MPAYERKLGGRQRNSLRGGHNAVHAPKHGSDSGQLWNHFCGKVFHLLAVLGDIAADRIEQDDLGGRAGLCTGGNRHSPGYPRQPGGCFIVIRGGVLLAGH